MAFKPATVAAYLDSLAPERRERFETLRAAVRDAAPETVEGIAYDMPAYRLGTRLVCSIGAFARHDSLFPASEAVVERLGGEVAPYVKGRGTLQFPHRWPLPVELIGRIVRIRVEETAEALAGKG